MSFSFRSICLNASLAACFLAVSPTFVFAQTHKSTVPNATTAPATKVAAKKTAAEQILLPVRYAEWRKQGAAKTGTSAAAADAANAGVLEEFGFKDFSEAAYKRGSDMVDIRALRFGDATGAYGAYTYYRQPGMEHEAIGNGAARDARRVIFWSGTTVVEATFDHPAVDEEAAMKALAKKLPVAVGSDAIAPTLPLYLPKQGLDRSTARYAIGPAAYVQGGGVLPVNVIDFSQDAEVVTAQYVTRGGRGTLTVIGYPTPQMAIHAEKELAALLKRPLPASLQKSVLASLAVHRSGPMLAVTSGDFTSVEAHALVDRVKYEAEVTLNRNIDFMGEVKNAGKMLEGIASLTGIILVCALVVALLLGSGRAMWRVMRGKPVSSVYEEEFIRLNLKD